MVIASRRRVVVAARIGFEGQRRSRYKIPQRANYAGFSASGLWHAGALAEVVGEQVAPNWVAVALMLASVAVAFALLKRDHDSTKNSPRAAGRAAQL